MRRLPPHTGSACPSHTSSTFFPPVDNLLDSNGLQRGSEQWKNEQSFRQPTMGDGVASFSSEEEGPGIEGFQIIGEAKPRCKLLGCGYPVRRTSLWATNPDYVVTADDVDKLIAVECIPMNEQEQ
ncbi:unnamed protein product [Fraxinus pennsylvanica]|uniref:Uncharacterized protein n=1 Tax=Fraxinus pennsylvanica TaxID=56036 RepID=A0AAD2E7N9_9LAMI|nr:unnamed protein product [Fraxinus pennsylvanica]